MTMRTCPDCDGFGTVVGVSVDTAGVTPTEHICTTCQGDCVVPELRACAICGEPEGSDYAKACCTADQMLTV